ncbi:unnamed protein product [Darwinula stevensoni]|uniref:Uncharacterized protein n=1 Tax=Darwinula stevensoni TaxID=69355 RepID=A0A7R9AEY6_9CRUS|nr:unnamed protein product [Darwinula stevensoni]CAG0901849.1 unnamed protein product [Darwinula stevensoni]
MRSELFDIRTSDINGTADPLEVAHPRLPAALRNHRVGRAEAAREPPPGQCRPGPGMVRGGDQDRDELVWFLPPSLTDLLNRLGITVSQTEQLIRWDTTSVVSSLITYAVPIVLVAVVMGYAWIVFGLVQFEVAAVGNSPKRQDEFPSDFYPLDAYPSGAYPSNVYSLDANISDTNLSDANPWGVNPSSAYPSGAYNSDAYPSDPYHSDGSPSDVYPSYVYQHPIRQDQNNNNNLFNNNLFSSEPQTSINESHSQPINDGNSKEDSHQEKKKKGVKKIKMKGPKARKMSFKDFLEGMPVLGHAIAVGHHVVGDAEGGERAMQAANRTTGLVVGTTVGVAAGAVGAVAGAAGGIVAGGLSGMASGGMKGMAAGGRGGMEGAKSGLQLAEDLGKGIRPEN